MMKDNPYLSQKKITQTLFVHHDVVRDSLKEKLAQIPDPNPDKR
jgi:hypothetical protein